MYNRREGTSDAAAYHLGHPPRRLGRLLLAPPSVVLRRRRRRQHQCFGQLLVLALRQPFLLLRIKVRSRSCQRPLQAVVARLSDALGQRDAGVLDLGASIPHGSAPQRTGINLRDVASDRAALGRLLRGVAVLDAVASLELQTAGDVLAI